MSTYVLVHGAWHGAWCWKKLTPLLESAGHRVFTPTLTGLGECADLLSPDVGLSTHIADVGALIERERLSDVVLVGHSYGGMVITGTVDRVPDRIGHLVYLDTFVPRDGDSMQSVAPIVVGVFRIEARLHGDGWRVDPPTREDFGVSQEPDRSWVRRSLTAQSLKSFVEPLRLTDSEIVSRFRRTHIYCAGRGHLVSLVQRTFMPRTLPPREPGWRLRRLRAGHDCMITDPRALANLLLEAGSPTDTKAIPRR
ncbi:MAG: alpha/beta fold hydrolase [Chloroflexi bacterium]|nr:MAG: alpha/beta fold hydrolase [Chloroflexota bacterium]